MNHSAITHKYPAHNRQYGLSLVELMISLTIGLFLLAGITTLIVYQSNARTEMEKSSQQIENGRYAIQILHDDIEHAGFFGHYSPPSSTAYTTPDPCLTDTTGWDSATPTVPVPIYGYAGSDATPGCLTNRMAGTAILAIRRTSTDTLPAASAVAGTTYFQVSRCSTSTAPFVVGTSGFSMQEKDCAMAATLRKYIVRIYYISTCDVCSPSDNIPTLKVMEFVDGVQTIMPLVEGIENMQFDYGIDTTAGGDGYPDSYTQTPAAADWQNVMAVRVNLLARNTETTGTYTDTRSYHLSGISSVPAVGAANDHYKRHVFSQVVRAVNPSSRRELP